MTPSPGMRVVQMTPPGSACSVVIGAGLPLGEPGSVMGVQLVVQDLDAVRSELAARGVAISDVQQMGPEGTPGSRYCFFQDPDGNMWAHSPGVQARVADGKRLRTGLTRPPLAVHHALISAVFCGSRCSSCGRRGPGDEVDCREPGGSPRSRWELVGAWPPGRDRTG